MSFPLLMPQGTSLNSNGTYNSGKVKATIDANPVPPKNSPLMNGVVALAGATAAGVYLIGGASASDFATSFSGSLGAAAGFAIGSYLDTTDEVMKYSSKSMMPVWPVVGAVAIPALAAGALDSDIAILAAGAWGGAYAYKYYQNYSASK